MSIPVIIGAGLAGLSAALSLSPRRVIVLGRKPDCKLTSSELAQGGIAAAIGSEDSITAHEEDTIKAGAGLCDPTAVHTIIGAGPQAIDHLIIWGVPFDRDDKNMLLRALEGAHTHRRVVHANGDMTGYAVMRAMVARVQAMPSITFIEDAEVSEIMTDDKGVTGVIYFQGNEKKAKIIQTDNVIVATGSACALWRHTTVPAASWGHGLLLAARAGARLRDMEFVQFHPTALNCGLDPMPLISEALRGEGAQLINDTGDHFVDELKPRDIVARAINDQVEMKRDVFLDARLVAVLRDRFHGIYESCLRNGINPSETPIPIRSVAHYHMGGIATDDKGRTNVRGLWAIGECACTGLHGANRLASNSLLEAVVMGHRLGEVLRPQLPRDTLMTISTLLEWQKERAVDSAESIAKVRNIMVAHVGVRRDAMGLRTAISLLEELASRSSHAQVGLWIAAAALARKESRGAHYRSDYPDADPSLNKSSFQEGFAPRILEAHRPATV